MTMLSIKLTIMMTTMIITMMLIISLFGQLGLQAPSQTGETYIHINRVCMHSISPDPFLFSTGFIL
jgi:hypothetical protein